MNVIRYGLALSVIVAALMTAAVRAAELRAEPLNEAAPSDELSPEIAGQLSPTGLKVLSGASRSLCDIWFAKQWSTKEGFKPSNTVQYPFEPGQLIGVIQFRRKGGDFRGQEIEKGVYVLRYAQQPEDGNHVGTSDTRDFLVLLKAADDRAPAVLTKEVLFKLSAAAAGTTHPCMLSLLAPGKDTSPNVEHDEAKEWSILRSGGSSKSGPLAVRVVVEGKAAE